MIRAVLARLQQKHRTTRFPKGPAPAVSDRFRGRPEVAAHARAACPFGALSATSEGVASLDLGRCLFCGECAGADAGVRFTQDYRLAARRREDLVLKPGDALKFADALDAKSRKLFGRSLRLRQVSAGGCNACEADTNVLTTIGWDLQRFGIDFVASPRHADGLLVTGPVTENMRLALMKTYDAVPAPKLVIAVGACAISGGPYAGSPEAHDGVAGLLPVDLYVPGCPPHPITILDGLLRLLGRI